jgi:hypothetical protein
MTVPDSPVPGKPPSRRAYHARLVAAALEHTKAADIAAASGVSERTYRRWRAIPENAAEVEAARGEVIKDAIALLRNGLPLAARRLVKVASESPTEGVAVRAAIAVIEAHGSLTQRTELEERLERVEQLLTGLQRTPAPNPGPWNRSGVPTVIGLRPSA